jgi:hypothetical protein
MVLGGLLRSRIDFGYGGGKFLSELPRFTPVLTTVQEA